LAEIHASSGLDQPKNGLTHWIRLRFARTRDLPEGVDESLLADLSQVRQVGRYRIMEKLGQGSTGVVYLGKDPYIGRSVAIKISRPAAGISRDGAERYRERFFTEAQSAGRLAHPNVVAIYDAGMHGDFCYIAMEYIDGPTLLSYCGRENLLPVNRAVETIFNVCKGLDYAHKMGVIHRDVKPSNIMINKAGEIKIADFGIARVASDDPQEPGLVGSPSYMSPEQVREEPVEERSDVFSLGCVLYELLTGSKAFSGENTFSILYKITHEDPAPVCRIRSGLPEILDRIVLKALHKDPNRRYQNCADLAYDLRVALRGMTDNVVHSKAEDLVDYIQQVPFFEGFSREQVHEILGASNLLRVSKGKVVVNEGEIDDSFYVILSGRAEVRKKDRTLATVNRGECFGEMSYLSGESRAATVVAATNCILIRISATLLDRASEGMQILFLRRFAKTLLARLTRSNQLKG
jgi:serine/threonine-protein kinase